VLFAKASAPVEVVNDLDRTVKTFFRVLRDTPDELIRALRYTPYARDEFAAADLSEDGISDVERARRFFVRTTQGHNAAGSGGRAGWSNGIRTRHTDATATRNLVERLDQVADRLRTVVVDNRDAAEVIDDFHRGLAKVLHQVQGAVLLSGYPSALYDELYAGWDRIEVAVHRAATNSRGRTAVPRGIEVVWSNRPLSRQVSLFEEVS
jgi:DNA adenine methylase